MSHSGGDRPAGNPLEQVRSLYTELANHPERDFGWGKGRDNARLLGYAVEWLDCLPQSVWESAAAVGNPFSLGPVNAGEKVVDIGCGAGADACVAALLVGVGGRVVGVDCTPAMRAKAAANATVAGLPQLEFHEADMRKLPLQDCCADVAISNGASTSLKTSRWCWKKSSGCFIRVAECRSLTWCVILLPRIPPVLDAGNPGLTAYPVPLIRIRSLLC